MTSLLLAYAMLPSSGCSGSQIQRPTIVMGWHDELNSRSQWSPLAMENQARVSGPPGILLLSLGQVPANWPYTFQWSGVSRECRVDIARFPVLSAYIPWVRGYAHLDVDVLNAEGDSVKTFRSTTLNQSGVSSIDLSSVLDPAYYSLRLRLIVGGENSGCEATYDWIRFVGKKDAEFLAQNPGWTKLRLHYVVPR